MSGTAGARRTSLPSLPYEPAPPTARPAWVARELGDATGRGVRVAVIDSGWDRSLPEPRVLPGIGLASTADELALGRSDDDGDRNGHGTACADQILRMAPDARVLPARVFGAGLETSPSVLCEALRWAVEERVDVVNMSLGTTRDDTRDHLYVLCERARRQGTIVVAAGNNVGGWSYPAVFENAVGVDAGKLDSPFTFRYRPDEAMECLAWGLEVPVLWLGGRRIPRSGTSFAAPHIAGIVALIRERHPGASLEDVRGMLARFSAPE
ncbi:MAG: serine protease [Gemmatimonadetes bacterium]|nr:serine protease [Gemmatimonadota bacterium]